MSSEARFDAFLRRLRADPDPSWRQHAACRGLDPALFFPERGDNSTLAAAVCATCPVRAECLDYALAAPERHGVWGGMPEHERRRLRRQQLRQAS